MNEMSAITPEQANDYRARFTAAEFRRIAAAADEHGIDLELVKGELARMSPPMGSHSARQTNLLRALFEVERRAGLTAAVEVGLNLGNDTITTGDAALLHAPHDERSFVSPNEVAVVIEVAETTLNRDLGAKRRLYAEASIATYWVVDGAKSVVHVFREPEAGDYRDVTAVPFGEPLAVPGTDATITIT